MFTPLSAAHQQAISSSPYGSAIVAAIEAAGIVIENNNIGGWQATDPVGAQAIVDSVAAWLPFHKKAKLEALSARYGEHFDHHKLAHAGAAPVTPGGLSAHWAGAISNFRALKRRVENAATPGDVDAIDITAGWPANP